MTEPATAEPAPDPYPETPLSARIDAILRRFGEALSWLWLPFLPVIAILALPPVRLARRR